MERTVTFDDEEWQLVPRKPTPAMLGRAIASTAAWLSLSGSAMTVNYKKASIRYRAMLSVAPCPYPLERNWDREFEQALADRANTCISNALQRAPDLDLGLRTPLADPEDGDRDGANQQKRKADG